jgi:hypothetical protein
MKRFFNKLYDITLRAYIYLVLVWVVFALSFQIFFLYLHFTKQEDRARMISNEIMWKLDGRFSETAKNE